MKWLCRNSLSTKSSDQGSSSLAPPIWRALPTYLKVASGAALGTLSSVAWGLGLGDLQPRSYLGEPFKGTLELVSVDSSIDPDALRIRRLSAVEAERMGVEVFYTANHFDFTVVRNAQGGLSIQVVSAEPIKEPFLNLVVEMRWRTGTVYRDYPILLDLPPDTFAREPRSSEPSAAQERVGTAPRESTPARAMSLPPLTTAEGQYQVSAGDTLSTIAARWREGSEQSLTDTSRWLFENNPHAFINNDQNRLRAGAVLQMPDLSAYQLAGESSAGAAPVSAESAAPPSARVTAAESAASPAPSGRAPSADAVVVDGTRGMLTVGAETRDDRTRELIDMLVRENESLQARVERLENSEYLSTLQSLLLLQRQQISELRAELGVPDNEVTEEMNRLFGEIGLSQEVAVLERRGAERAGESAPAARDQTVVSQPDSEPTPEQASPGSDLGVGAITLERPTLGAVEPSQRNWLFAALVGAGLLLTLAFAAMFAYYRKMVPARLASGSASDGLSEKSRHAQPFKAELEDEDDGIAYPEGMDTQVKIYQPERAPNWLGEQVTLDEFDASREALFADEVHTEFENLSLDEDALEAVMAGTEQQPSESDSSDDDTLLDLDERSLEAITEELPEDRKASKRKEARRPDEEVRMSIAEKMAQYDPEFYRADLESLGVMELDESADGEGDEIDTLVYRAMMFCEFKKFSKARQLLEGRIAHSDDPRLKEALEQIEAIQVESEKRA